MLTVRHARRTMSAPKIYRNRQVLPILCLFFLSIAAPLLATGNYLAAGHPDGVALLPPPPSPDTPEYVADLTSARAVFKGRSSEQESRAFKLATLTIFNFSPA